MPPEGYYERKEFYGKSEFLYDSVFFRLHRTAQENILRAHGLKPKGNIVYQKPVSCNFMEDFLIEGKDYIIVE